MATSSVPTLNMAARWRDPQQCNSQSSNDKNTSLEIAMNGMNIVSTYGTSPVEFSTTDMQSDINEEHQRKHIISSGDSVHSQRSNSSNASPLPAKPIHRLQQTVPPIGRPGHSKSCSTSTTQSLTLTPTSSVDGTDIHDYNKRGGKEDHEPPLRITTTIGDGFDGLHGARERANTAPGMMAFPPLDNSFHGSMTRSVSRDRNQLPPSRPPLSGSLGYNHDSGEGRARSIIARPGYPPVAGEAFLQRSTSEATGRESMLTSAFSAQSGMDQQHGSSKFNSFSSIGSQLPPQSGLNPNQPCFQPVSMHQRSLSNPAPDFLNQYQHQQEAPLHFGQTSDFGISKSEHGIRPPMRYRNHSFGSAEEVSRAEMHRRTPLQSPPSSIGSGYYDQSHMNQDHIVYNDGPQMVGNSGDMRLFMNEFERGVNPSRNGRMVSPAHSPIHQQYGHSIHYVDSLSSPTLGMGGSGMRGGGGKSRNSYGKQAPRHHRAPSLDDDSSHPLAGENIEVPSDDRGFMLDSSSRSVSESTHHLPTAGASLPLAKLVYSVKFKRTQRSFVIGPRLNRDLKIGTYVKVEADRGEDLGIVVGKVTPEKRSNFRGDMGIMPPSTGMGGTTPDLKRIIRLATHDEVSLLTLKREEEEDLLKICRTKVRQRGLPMNVVDAEYQFDRHKLTFFFEAEGRVDFRELVRDLFSIYKTRIWMQQLDKNTSASCRAAVNPPAPVVMDYGTPIIAPVSEFREFVTGGTNIETD